ncbi:MAG TPA: 2-deoxyribose-5-phosphate aldolase, partial [Desulfosporosinus sp.]|nr:2-deoxyribose-5-phosphate aldolase [Desulfosporosinus sp.]
VARVVEAAHGCGLIIKVIIETCLLSEDEKEMVSKIVKRAGADYIKTSTGFAGGGATVEDVSNLKAWVGENVKVKASGGIRTREFALELIEAGAERLGTSAVLV